MRMNRHKKRLPDRDYDTAHGVISYFRPDGNYGCAPRPATRLERAWARQQREIDRAARSARRAKAGIWDCEI